MHIKHWFFLTLGVISFWLLFAERSILTPFVVAFIFSYIFHPVVDFLSEKVKLPRVISILLLYFCIFGILTTIGLIISYRIGDESIDFKKVVMTTLAEARNQVKSLPDWMQPFIKSVIVEFQHSRIVRIVESPAVFPISSAAVSRIVSFFIFLFSGFYFLKDGKSFVESGIAFFPKRNQLEIEILFRKINTVLGDYLRGQLLLVFIMALITYLALMIIGVKFALTIALFTGFAEIVPFVGPIVAGGLAVSVVMITGFANFGLSPLNASIVISAVYFVLRYLEDYFVIPHVMNRVTKLPPFIIFFAVVAGGHIAGILGLILAVPIAAILRLLIAFFLDRIAE